MSNLYELNLGHIITEEDRDAFIYRIREEIIQKVMNEINESYLRNKLLQFMSDCAIEAISKFISFEFYYHNTTPNLDNEWKSGEPIPPSKPDTWACGNLEGVKPAVTVIDHQEPVELAQPCKCDQTVCSCTAPQKTVMEYVEAVDKESVLTHSIVSSLDTVMVTEKHTDSTICTEPLLTLPSAESVTMDVDMEKFLKVKDIQKIILPKINVPKLDKICEKKGVLQSQYLQPIRIECEIDSFAKTIEKDKKKRTQNDL